MQDVAISIYLFSLEFLDDLERIRRYHLDSIQRYMIKKKKKKKQAHFIQYRSGEKIFVAVLRNITLFVRPLIIGGRASETR